MDNTYLFSFHIAGRASWAQAFRDISLFTPLCREICHREGLPFYPLTSCPMGTHAVFFMGDCVIKLYAPKEAELGTSDKNAECFGLAFAAAQGVSAPEILAHGIFSDRYDFHYLVTRRISGVSFDGWKQGRSDPACECFGQSLRLLTNKLNVPVHWPDSPAFPGELPDNPRFAAFPQGFRQERRAILRDYLAAIRPRDFVFTHADLCSDNVLCCKDGLSLIDFGDARIAPVLYEHTVIACELFQMDARFIRGFFGDCNHALLAKEMTTGLLLHAFGPNIIRDHYGSPDTFESVSQLTDCLRRRLDSTER